DRVVLVAAAADRGADRRTHRRAARWAGPSADRWGASPAVAAVPWADPAAGLPRRAGPAVGPGGGAVPRAGRVTVPAAPAASPAVLAASPAAAAVPQAARQGDRAYRGAAVLRACRAYRGAAVRRACRPGRPGARSSPARPRPCTSGTGPSGRGRAW